MPTCTVGVQFTARWSHNSNQWLLATIPRDLLKSMKVADSMRTRSILFCVTSLREELGVLTVQHIAEVMQALRTPHVHPSSVRGHLNTLMGLFAELAANL